MKSEASDVRGRRVATGLSREFGRLCLFRGFLINNSANNLANGVSGSFLAIKQLERNKTGLRGNRARY